MYMYSVSGLFFFGRTWSQESQRCENGIPKMLSELVFSCHATHSSSQEQSNLTPGIHRMITLTIITEITSQTADAHEVTHAPQIPYEFARKLYIEIAHRAKANGKRQCAQNEEDVSEYGGNEKSKHKDTAQRSNVKFYENFNLQLINGMRTMKLLFVTAEICAGERRQCHVRSNEHTMAMCIDCSTQPSTDSLFIDGMS